MRMSKWLLAGVAGVRSLNGFKTNDIDFGSTLSSIRLEGLLADFNRVLTKIFNSSNYIL